MSSEGYELVAIILLLSTYEIACASATVIWLKLSPSGTPSVRVVDILKEAW